MRSWRLYTTAYVRTGPGPNDYTGYGASNNPIETNLSLRRLTFSGMIELMNVAMRDGSRVFLGALLDHEQLPPETNVPGDAPLGLWHERSPFFDRANPRSIAARLGSIWPVLVGGDSFFVVAGEVEEGVDRVRLLFSEPGQEPHSQQVAHVANIRERRVWMSHPEKMRRRTVVSAEWLPGGESESLTVPVPE